MDVLPRLTANSFMHTFKSNSTPNNRENDRFSPAYADYVTNHNESCDCKSAYIILPNVIDAVLWMKKGKSSDDDKISAEHLHYTHLNVLVRITNENNQMLRHSFVPKQFRLGFMVPIIKDNYRGITISPIISKLFEHVLKNIFIEHPATSPQQFGFKKNNSTVHALWTLP